MVNALGSLNRQPIAMLYILQMSERESFHSGPRTCPWQEQTRVSSPREYKPLHLQSLGARLPGSERGTTQGIGAAGLAALRVRGARQRTAEAFAVALLSGISWIRHANVSRAFLWMFIRLSSCGKWFGSHLPVSQTQSEWTVPTYRSITASAANRY